MNTCAIFFVTCLVFACAAAIPAPEPAREPEQGAYHAPLHEVSKPAPYHAPLKEQDGSRAKRFFPYGPAISTVSGYSYLAPYANSGKIVHYPAPVLSSYAAVPAISSYHAFPAISTYAASPFAAYHAF